MTLEWSFDGTVWHQIASKTANGLEAVELAIGFARITMSGATIDDINARLHWLHVRHRNQSTG